MPKVLWSLALTERVQLIYQCHPTVTPVHHSLSILISDYIQFNAAETDSTEMR